MPLIGISVSFDLRVLLYFNRLQNGTGSQWHPYFVYIMFHSHSTVINLTIIVGNFINLINPGAVIQTHFNILQNTVRGFKAISFYSPVFYKKDLYCIQIGFIRSSGYVVAMEFFIFICISL